MGIPAQIQNQIANDLALLVIDRIHRHARQRMAALHRKVTVTTDTKEREALKREADEFEQLSRIFDALTDPDTIS